MTNTQQIAQGFDLLRTQCDPRGHALLDALQSLCIVEAMALDSALGAMGETPVETNVIPLVRDYSVKAPA
jgi:hypothetical protein